LEASELGLNTSVQHSICHECNRTFGKELLYKEIFNNEEIQQISIYIYSKTKET